MPTPTLQLTRQGFFANDDLTQSNAELMDWNGDHPHTNSRALFAAARAAGFFLETLPGNFLSFDAAQCAARRRTHPAVPPNPPRGATVGSSQAMSAGHGSS